MPPRLSTAKCSATPTTHRPTISTRAIRLITADMLHSLFKQGNDMCVSNTVVDLFAIPPRGNEMHLSQPAHMMRDSRFGDPDQLCQCADVFLAIQQGRHNAYPAGIAKGAEKLGDMGA